MSFDIRTMPHAKIGITVVLTDELVRSATPGATRMILRAMVNACAAFEDQQFIDETNSGSSSAPAAINYGALEVPSTGSSIANITTDIGNLLAGAIAADLTFANSYFVMRPRTALYLSATAHYCATFSRFRNSASVAGSFSGCRFWSVRPYRSTLATTRE